MSYNSLREFLDTLDKTGNLQRVKVPVSTVLEMTEIQTRLLAEKGPAVLFENVYSEHGPNKIRVLANLFGTVERVALGMNLKDKKDLRQFGEMLAFFRQPAAPNSFKDVIACLPMVKKAMAMKPKYVTSAPCQEIILTGEQVDLSILPIQTCWPGEPAPLITWPLVVTKATKNAAINEYNLGIYRMQVTGKNTTLMRWLKVRGGACHHANWTRESQDMPVAVVLGADPSTIIAAVTPVPENMSEYQFAGLIRGKSLELVDCKTVPLKVPAQAEIVLEGYINLNDYQDEGPYGDHTGYYNSVEQFPVFTITAITMRRDPIYLTTFTSRPPDEPSVLGEALNEVFIPLLVQQFPEIVDFWLPPEACSYRIAVVSIKKSYAGHAKRIMMGIWGYLRQFMYTKFIIVVDDDIDCRNWQDVMWAISTRVDPLRDTVMIDNTPIDYLDFASPLSGLGSKMGIDATNKISPESDREWGKKIVMNDETIDKVTKSWQSYGLQGSGKPIWTKK